MIDARSMRTNDITDLMWISDREGAFVRHSATSLNTFLNNDDNMSSYYPLTSITSSNFWIHRYVLEIDSFRVLRWSFGVDGDVALLHVSFGV